MKTTAAAAVEVSITIEGDPNDDLAERVYNVRRRLLDAARMEFIDGQSEVVVRLLHSTDSPETWKRGYSDEFAAAAARTGVVLDEPHPLDAREWADGG